MPFASRSASAVPMLLILLLAGCSPPDPTPDDAALPRRDAAPVDADGLLDAGPRPDGGGTLPDGGPLPPDSGRDSGPRPDAGPSTCTRFTDTGIINALYIGNSQIDFWNLPQIVEDLSASAPAGCARIEGTPFTIGGANLRDLWESPLPDGRMLESQIATGGYDVVVIAESIDLAEVRPAFPALFIEYATRIVDAAVAAGAVPILYATPYVDDAPLHEGFRAMADPQLALGEDLGVSVAAGGLAWLKVWEELPELDLHHFDHGHPSYKGSYISSLVIWAAITGGSPIGLDRTLEIFCDGVPCPPIPDAEVDVFQSAAAAQHLETGGL